MKQSAGKQSSDQFEFGPFKFDRAGQVLTRDGTSLPLKRQSAAVLALLVENAGSVVTRTTIRDTVWHDRTIEFDDGINACIRDIRRVLGDNSKDPIYVETIPKTGYRLKARAAPSKNPGSFGLRRLIVVLVGAALVAAFVAITVIINQPAATNESGLRDRIAVMPFTISDTAVSAQEQVDQLTNQFVALLAERQNKILVISVGELFADNDRQPGLGDVSRWLSVDYLLAGSIAGEAGAKSLTLRVIRTDGYVHLWSKTVAISQDQSAVIAERLFTEMITDAREEGGQLLFASAPVN